MLGLNEIRESESRVREVIEGDLESILIDLNRKESLKTFLQLLGIESYKDKCKVSSNMGKIVVLGETKVSENDLKGIVKGLGIDINRFEFCLGYDNAKKYNYRKTQWNSSYSLILVGPMPHSGKGKGEFSSIITALENEEGYPRVERLGTNELKITKTNFRQVLEKMKEQKVI